MFELVSKIWTFQQSLNDYMVLKYYFHINSTSVKSLNESDSKYIILYINK